MSFSHLEVAHRWAEGDDGKGHHMFSKDGVCYSYGHHFPIAVFLNPDEVLFNNDKYSSSTSTHQRLVRGALPEDIKIYECTTEEIERYIANPKTPIVITKQVEPDDLNSILMLLRNWCKRNGLKRFPLTKWKDMIERRVVADNI